MFFSSVLHIYRQSVKQATIASSSIGVMYGIGLYNNKNPKKTLTETIGKYAGLGALCGIVYPISISFYTVQMIKECIRNPYSPSTDAAIL